MPHCIAAILLAFTLRTNPGGDFHHTPGVVASLPDDEIQFVIPEAVLQNVLDRRTQMFQDQTGDRRTAGAVTQSHLRQEERNREKTVRRIFLLLTKGFENNK